jgi:hypothetical protein
VRRDPTARYDGHGKSRPLPVLPPYLDQDLGLLQTVEILPIQQRVPQLALQAFACPTVKALLKAVICPSVQFAAAATPILSLAAETSGVIALKTVQQRQNLGRRRPQLSWASQLQSTNL